MKLCTRQLAIIVIPLCSMIAASASAANNSMITNTATLAMQNTVDDALDFCGDSANTNRLPGIEQRRSQSIAGFLGNTRAQYDKRNHLIDTTHHFSGYEQRALKTRVGPYLQRTQRNAINTVINPACEVS